MQISNTQQVRVERREPKPRDALDGYTGILGIELKVDSSYLRVGGGSLAVIIKKPESLTLEPKEETVHALARHIEIFEKPFTKYSDGSYYIPGSSVKGNIRSRIELSALPRNEWVRTCFSVYDPRRIDNPKCHNYIWRTSLQWRGRCDHTRSNKVCRLCDIFGAPGLASRVYFSDFVCTENCVSTTEKCRDQNLEVMREGAIFAGEVAVRGLEPWEMGALLWGMGVEKLDEWGTRLLFGGCKYARTDFGVVRFRITGYRPVTSISPMLPASFTELLGMAENELWLERVNEVTARDTCLGGEGK